LYKLFTHRRYHRFPRSAFIVALRVRSLGITSVCRICCYWFTHKPHFICQQTEVLGRG